MFNVEFERDTHKKLSFVAKKIESICSREKKTNINIIVVNEIKKKYVYLQLKRKINCLRDLAFNVLLLNVEFDAWNPTTVWSNKANARKWKIFHNKMLVLTLFSNHLWTLSNSSLEQKQEQKEEKNMSKIQILICKYYKEIWERFDNFDQNITFKSRDISCDCGQDGKQIMLASLCTDCLTNLDKNNFNLSGCFCGILEYYQFFYFCWNLKYKLNSTM